MKFTDLKQRLVTAFAVAAVVLALLLYRGLPLAIAGCFMAVACSYEQLRFSTGRSRGWSLLYASLAAFPLLAYYVRPESSASQVLAAGIAIYCVSLCFLQLAECAFIRQEPLVELAPSLTSILSTVCYPVVPAVILAVAVFELPFITSFSLLLLISANDTGAYLGGSRFGGAKLLPRISPGKTWSGVVSGLLLAAIVACVLKFFAVTPFLASSYLQAILFGVMLGTVANLGDLFESLLKRAYNCKDSGRWLPGHGGVLDRVDSHLFVFPCVLVLSGAF